MELLLKGLLSIIIFIILSKFYIELIKNKKLSEKDLEILKEMDNKNK